MLYFRSGLFYLFYVSTAFLIGLLGCIIGPFLTLNRRIKFLSVWPRFSNWLLYKTCRIKILVLGIENIPEPPFVVVSNHQGQSETFYYQYLFFPLTTLLKKELLLIPIWGWALWLLRPIAIDRGSPRSSLKKVLVEGGIKLKKGFVILFFPEGTRNKPNEVGKFARSGFELAKRNEVPVLPLAHNSGSCWPAHKFLKYPGNIILKIGKPLKKITSTIDAARNTEEWARKEVSNMKNLN